MTATTLPPPVAAAGVRSAHELDVRPLLARGEEPFDRIMQAVRSLGADEALHMIAPFEPRPLYGVMRSFGRTAHTEREGGAVHIWFYCENAGGGGAAKQPVMLEVSGAEPGGATGAILGKLAELGANAELLVQCREQPAGLAEQLAARGYAAHTEQRCEGDLVIHVAPLAVLERRGR